MNRETKRLRRSDPRARLFVHEATQPSADEVVKHSWALVVKSVSLQTVRLHTTFTGGTQSPKSRQDTAKVPLWAGPRAQEHRHLRNGEREIGRPDLLECRFNCSKPMGNRAGFNTPHFFGCPLLHAAPPNWGW